MLGQARSDVYFSADVETDGPIPGEFSLLSFAICVAGRYDGRHYRREESGAEIFYAELKPVSDRYEAEALKVNGLDRTYLAESGLEPSIAMRSAADWIEDRAGEARAVLVAYPVAFDWTFLYWYFMRFAGASPFGFSSCPDIRTLYQARTLSVHDRAAKRFMPTWLQAKHQHTHHAVDDALEQGELFSNLFEWSLAGGGIDATEYRSRMQPSPPDWLVPLAFPLATKTCSRAPLLPGLIPKASNERDE